MRNNDTGLSTEALLALDDREFLLGIRIEHIDFGSPRGTVVYRRFVETCIRYARFTRTELFKRLLETDSGFATSGKTLDAFKKRYKDITWMGKATAAKLVTLLFSEKILDRAIEAISVSPSRRPPDEDVALFNIVQKYVIGHPTNLLDADLIFQLAGAYQYWRHSTSMPGCYTKGLALIFPNPEHTRMYVYSYQSYSGSAASNSLTPTKNKLRSRNEELRGYVFSLKRSGFLFMIRGHNIPAIRFLILTDISNTPGIPIAAQTIFSMGGYAMGASDARGFISPIYFERISNKYKISDDPIISRYKEELDVFSADDTPLKIRKLLSAKLEVF